MLPAIAHRCPAPSLTNTPMPARLLQLGLMGGGVGGGYEGERSGTQFSRRSPSLVLNDSDHGFHNTGIISDRAAAGRLQRFWSIFSFLLRTCRPQEVESCPRPWSQ